jgi:hypothetical protein
MAGEPSRKAFGEYQGQRVSPIPEGFLAAYANVAKNIESTGENIGKGLEGIMVKYAQAEQNRTNLTNSLRAAAPDAQTAVEYYHGIAKENLATIPDFNAANSETSDGPEFNSNVQFRLAAADMYAKNAKEIEDYISNPDKHSNDDMIRILGLIQAGKADATEYAKTAAENAKASLARAKTVSDIEVNKTKIKTANDAAAKAASPTSDSVVKTVIDDVAQGARAVESARNGLTPEQAKAEYNKLKTALEKQIEAHQLSIQRGGPPLLTEQDVLTVNKELAGLDAYVKAVDPAAIEEWKSTYGSAIIRAKQEVGHVEDIAKFNAKLEEMKKSSQNLSYNFGTTGVLGTNTSTSVDSIFPQVNKIAGVADLESKIQLAKDNLDYHIKYNPNTELYLGSEYGTDGDKFYTQVQERRAMAQTVARIQATYATTDWQGRPVLGTIQPHELEQIQKVVKLGGLGVMDELGRRWKIEKDGRLSYTMDEKFDGIMKKDPERRTAEEVKYVNQTLINSGKVNSELAQSYFGSSTIKTITTPNGTINQLAPIQTSSILYVPDHPELSIHVSGQANVDPNRGKRLAEFATSNKTINEAQDIINKMVRLDEFGHPAPDPLTGEIQPLSKAELTDEDRRELALRYYQLIKGYAQGLGVRLTDTHYKLVSGMMGIPVDALTSNVDKKFFGVVITEEMRKAMLPPNEMIDLLKSSQHEIHDEVWNRINNGVDFYAIDKDGKRIGNLYASHGLGNHIKGGVGIDGLPAKAGTPVAQPAFVITRKHIKDGQPPTASELKVLRDSYQFLDGVIMGQIKSANSPDEINDVGATWSMWVNKMETKKLLPTDENPERSAFIDACVRQGMTLESVKWWINSSTNKQITQK